MLQFFRDRLTGAMVWVFAALIIVPFAFWGVESFRGGGGDPTVADVGGVKITQSQFHGAYQQRFAQLQELMGERAAQIDTDRLRTEVLNAMVEETALRQFARQAGYRASDVELIEQLREIPAFQENGKFSQSAYTALLARRGQSAQQFETLMRNGLVLQQLQDTLSSSHFEVDEAVKLLYRIEHQQRSFDYVRIDPAKFLDAVEITDAQLHAEFDAHAELYRSPERVKLQYVELAIDKLGEAPTPAKDVLKAIYDEKRLSMFATPEERHARQLLVAFGADKEAAHKKAEALADQLKKGGDFAALVKEKTDDLGSKASGGDLGWVRRGNTPAPAFEAALYALQPGEVSVPVETPYGWHIIKLEGVHPEDVKAFDDAAVQQQLLGLYKQQWAAQTFHENSDKLDQLSFENPSSLDPVAKALGLTVTTTDWLTRESHEGIAATPAVMTAAFSPVVVQDGENSKPLQLSPTDWVVIRKAEYEPSRQLSFDEVVPRVRETVRRNAALAKAKAIADGLVAAVQGGQPFSAAAKAQGLSVQTVALANRVQLGVDAALLNGAFRLAAPAAGKVTMGQATLDQDAVGVIALNSVIEGDWQKAPSGELQQLASRLHQGGAGAEFNAYQNAAQQDVGVKIVSQPSTAD
jgi:peptidyl-prolyl cis-trans isomerase D